MSRPEKPVDWAKVDNLLMAGCLGTEIATHFDMHPDTFYNKVQDRYKMGFTQYCSLKRAQGDSILRAKQYEKALSKDNTMMIWLGKNRLGQRENNDPVAPLSPVHEQLKDAHEEMTFKSRFNKLKDDFDKLQEQLNAVKR